MNTSFSIRYRAEVRSSSGEVRGVHEGHNLVMRSRIGDFFGRAALTSHIAKFGAGTGNIVANSRDSGLVTFSNSWTDSASSFTVTASAGFFVAGDVGQVLKLDSGEELVISAYTSGTAVTVSPYPTAPTAAQEGTIWNDTQTSLEAIIPQWGTTTSFNAGSTNMTVVTGPAGTATGTLIQTAQTTGASTSYTLYELGWFTSGGVLIGRAQIPGGLAMVATDYIVCTLTINYTFDATAKAVSAPGAHGDFSGTSRFYGAGAADLNNALMNGNKSIGLIAPAVDLSTVHSVLYGGSGVIGSPSAPSASDIPSDFPSRFVRRYSVSQSSGSGTINAISLGYSGAVGVWIHALTTGVSKTTLQTVTAAFDASITRILVN